VSFPIQSGHGCIGCSEEGFWDKGTFYDRLTNIKEFGIEANADKVGGTVAGVIGTGIAAHAAVSAVKRARMKAGETQAPALTHTGTPARD
jgi:hydrogenase small subunit